MLSIINSLFEVGFCFQNYYSMTKGIRFECGWFVETKFQIIAGTLNVYETNNPQAQVRKIQNVVQCQVPNPVDLAIIELNAPLTQMRSIVEPIKLTPNGFVPNGKFVL